MAFHITKHMTRISKPLEFIPETHIVSAKLQLGNEKERLQQAASRNQQDGLGSVWIVKPENRNRGRDITVHESMGELLEVSDVQ